MIGRLPGLNRGTDKCDYSAKIDCLTEGGINFDCP